jgi:hypothetical protein
MEAGLVGAVAPNRRIALWIHVHVLLDSKWLRLLLAAQASVVDWLETA